MVLTLRKIYQDTNSHRKSRKQNKSISKQKQNSKLKNRRPNNCISKKYLENDKYRENRKKITS